MEDANVEKEQNTETISSIHQKVLFREISSWLLGRGTHLKIRGTKRQIEVFARTLKTLKEFHDELQNPGTTLLEVKKKMWAKNSQIVEFEKTFHIKWPTQL